MLAGVLTWLLLLPNQDWSNNTQVKQMSWETAEWAVIVQSLVSTRCDSAACYVPLETSIFFFCFSSDRGPFFVLPTPSAEGRVPILDVRKKFAVYWNVQSNSIPLVCFTGDEKKISSKGERISICPVEEPTENNVCSLKVNGVDS